MKAKKAKLLKERMARRHLKVRGKRHRSLKRFLFYPP